MGIEDGCPEAPDLKGEKSLSEFLAWAADEELADWAHDSSEGGLAVAAAEVCIAGRCGIEMALRGDLSDEELLFGEIPGRVLLGTANPAAEGRLLERARQLGLGLARIGETSRTSDRLKILSEGKSLIDVSVYALEGSYEGSLPSLMAHPLA